MMAAGTSDLLVSLPHIMQRHHWDCGLACAQMVLRYLNRDIDDFDSVCKSLGVGESVWTIDLTLIMKHFNIQHCFCTITLGVDISYSGKSFYRSRFEVDQMRVNNLFSQVEHIGLRVEQRSLNFDEIKRHLLEQQVAIVLVDWNLLYCLRCQSVQSALGCTASCMTKCLGRVSSYQGHFIVLCGFSAKDNLIYYKNPSSKKEYCVCTVDAFDRARRAHGTDEDILLIFSDSVVNHTGMSNYPIMSDSADIR